MKTKLRLFVIGSLAVFLITSTVQAEIWNTKGSIVYKESNKVTFENVAMSRNETTVTVTFDWSIWAKNNTEIDQLLVSVNGKVVEFVFDGIAGNRGKTGSSSVVFNTGDFPSVDDKRIIELGFCEDYTAVQAKKSYEGRKKGGYRVAIGSVE